MDVVFQRSDRPIWLTFITLIFNPKTAHSAFRLFKYGINVALVMTAANGRTVPTAGLFVISYLLQ